jgi:hypothetical protein
MSSIIMLNAIYSKKFTRNDINIVLEFCLKKLKLKSAFQLNDRFEGKQFYENKLKNYLISRFILEELLKYKIEKEELTKVIFWNYKKYLLKSIKDVIVTDDIISVSKLLNENNIIIFTNISSMRVQLFSNLELDKVNFQKFNKISNV